MKMNVTGATIICPEKISRNENTILNGNSQHSSHTTHHTSGISLITLIITIIVIIILAAIVIFTGLNTPDRANFAKFAQEFSGFHEAVTQDYFAKKTKYSIANQYKTDEQIYYEIAKGREYDGDINATSIYDGTISSLGIAVQPSPIEGTGYFVVSDDKSVANWNSDKGYYNARSAETHYITDKGEPFILPGYRVEEDGQEKWYINESKYYLGSGVGGGGSTVDPQAITDLELMEAYALNKYYDEIIDYDSYTYINDEGTIKNASESIEYIGYSEPYGAYYEYCKHNSYYYQLVYDVNDWFVTEVNQVNLSDYNSSSAIDKLREYFIRFQGVYDINYQYASFPPIMDVETIVYENIDTYYDEGELRFSYKGTDYIVEYDDSIYTFMEIYYNIPDVGIGTDDQPVDLSLWNYTVINGNEIALYTETDWGYSHSALNAYGYSGEIVNGEIIGKVPKAIKIAGNDDYFPVTDMTGTFQKCYDLVTAPTLPNTVTNLERTFMQCTNLETVPTLPNSVVNMTQTFLYCYKLVNVPSIPNTVTNMYRTFDACELLSSIPNLPSSLIDMTSAFFGCTSLTSVPSIPNSVTQAGSAFSYCTSLVIAPVLPNSIEIFYNGFSDCTSLTTVQNIPNSVKDLSFAFCNCTSLTTVPPIPSTATNMQHTFDGCSKLTGSLVINANPTSYSNCLTNASTDTNADLTVTGSSSILSQIIATKSSNSNIH